MNFIILHFVTLKKTFNTSIQCIVCVNCKLQRSHNSVCEVRVNSSYSRFANDAKPCLRCRPTRSQLLPTVPTPMWFLQSRRQKSYREVAGLNVHRPKPNLRQTISLLAMDEVICGSSFSSNIYELLKFRFFTNFNIESHDFCVGRYTPGIIETVFHNFLKISMHVFNNQYAQAILENFTLFSSQILPFLRKKMFKKYTSQCGTIPTSEFLYLIINQAIIDAMKAIVHALHIKLAKLK